MTQTQQTFLFDPGFAQHTTILSINVEYIYAAINQFKNFGQKKMKFKMLYPQIINMVNSNVGFCLGCLLWAVYIKSHDSAIIEGNPCLGDTYNEEESVEEVDYSIQYFTQLQKDAKYYLGTTYEINPKYIEVLEIYKDFLTLNKNFVETKTSNDIILPNNIKIPEQNDLEKIYTKIHDVIKTGKLIDLIEEFDLIKKG